MSTHADVLAVDQVENRAGQPFVQAYTDLKTLLAIEGNLVYAKALKEWEQQVKDLTERVERRKKDAADLINQLYNIVWGFSVFLGVVLAAVSQLGGSHCGVIWFPSTLSGFAAFVTVIGVRIKFTALREADFSLRKAKARQQEAATRVSNLRQEGLNFRFHAHTQTVGKVTPKSFWFERTCVILALVLFTGFFILSYIAIFCNLLVVVKWHKQWDR